MPYKLVKARGKDLYTVVSKPSGKKHSATPIPKDKAEAQMRLLYALESGYTPSKSGKGAMIRPKKKTK
jgi:hypothetical protein